MAVESTSPPENPRSRNMSPRISFSHDLSQYDVVPVEPHVPLSPSSLSASASFNFISHRDSVFPSSADELFSNGLLLPLQLPKPHPPPPPPSDDPRTGVKQSKKPKPPNSTPHTSSFWRFSRSRSCNCGGMYTGTLCPILLPRSKSTGSNSSSKKSEDTRKRTLVSAYQKPPLNKSFASNSGNGLRVSPVLNVASANLFGLGSLFSSMGRGDKINKKKLGI